MMGGEPLTNFQFIKKWIPFVKRRSQQQGVVVSISMTTNCTLVTDEVIAFWKKWDLHFHTSIDGPPDVQNINRPTLNGGVSSPLVEAGVSKILAEFPLTTARCTVIPETVGMTSESYLYFRELGYINIAMVPSDFDKWQQKDIEEYEKQFMLIAQYWLDDIRKKGTWVSLKNIDDWLIHNYHSGVALPLEIDNPFFDSELVQLPSSRNYIRLLTNVFQKYPNVR
jgi:sulfatase maturation enzyme AslB (radical SAM superfamily)